MDNMNDDSNKQDLDEIAQQIQSEQEAAATYVGKATTGFYPIWCAVNGIPLSGQIDDKRPYIADMSLAALSRKYPQNVIQKMPAMHAVANKLKHGAHTVILDYLLRNNVLNENTFGKSLMQKFWLAIEYAATYGFCPAYTPFRKKGNVYGAPLELVPYSDIGLTPYVIDANESDSYYITNWWSKFDIKSKIAVASDTNGWIKDNLEHFLHNSAPENRANQDKTGTINLIDESDSSFERYKVITKFERGIAGKPGKMTMVGGGKILRQQEIKSLTGYPRIMFLIIDPDWQRPFGRSRAKLAMPYWALNTSYMRSSAYMNEYNINPAKLIKGLRGKSKIELTPGNDIDAGDNPNADVRPITLETNTLMRAADLIQANTAAIQSVFGQISGSVGFGSGSNAGISRAPGWAKVQQAATDVDSNYSRRLLEDFIRQYAVNALDVIVSNYTGTETLLLDDEALTQIKNFEIQGMVIENDNEYQIDWDKFREGIKEIDVKVDYGSSVDESKDAQLQRETQALETIKSSGLVESGALSPVELGNMVRKATRGLTDDSAAGGFDFEPQEPQQTMQMPAQGEVPTSDQMPPMG